MRKLVFLLMACLIFRVSIGQEKLYKGIAEQLGSSAPEVQQLWPFEEELMELMGDDARFMIEYKLPFADGKASEITFDFETVRLMESAVYDHAAIPLGRLADLVKAQMPEGFDLEFAQENPNAMGMLFANDSDDDIAEIYFLAGGKEKSELLYFQLGKEESRHLRVNLNAKLAFRRVDIFEALRSQFPEAELDVREIWSHQEAYKYSDELNNPKGLRIFTTGFNTSIPLPLKGREDLGIEVETKQIIDAVLLDVNQGQVSLDAFEVAVRNHVPQDFDQQIAYRSDGKIFELYTYSHADSELMLWFSLREERGTVYFVEVEKGTDYIDNIIFEIKEKLNAVES